MTERGHSPEKAQPQTIAVRSGQLRSQYSEHSEALFLTSSFVFDSCEALAAAFAGETDDYVYSRYTNPTVTMLEQRLAALESAESAVAFSSGMAAITATCLTFLQQGKRLVTSANLFGTTRGFFTNWLPNLGIEVVHVALTDTDAWQQALSEPTDLVFVETPANPTGETIDLQWLAKLSKQAQAIFVVDNCFATPILQQPLELGADLSLHSTTKFLDGHGRCQGGIVAGRDELISKLVDTLRVTGACMSPFNAWVVLKALETLELRVIRSSQSALELAQWLEQHPAVARVIYPGLESHNCHALSAKQMSGFGSVLAFEVKGGKQQAFNCINNTRMLSITPNFGDNKSTIVHPSTTTHSRLTPEQRADVGISDALIRVGVGIESLDDIKADLEAGLSSCN